MKFLCDVHISIKVAKHLDNAGHIALHANSLPAKWHSTDAEICKCSDLNDLIVITKDLDFRDSFFLRGTPKKLVRVLLGNISNVHLIELLDQYLPEIKKLDAEGSFYVELGEKLTVFTPENN